MLVKIPYDNNKNNYYIMILHYQQSKIYINTHLYIYIYTELKIPEIHIKYLSKYFETFLKLN